MINVWSFNDRNFSLHSRMCRSHLYVSSWILFKLSARPCEASYSDKFIVTLRVFHLTKSWILMLPGLLLTKIHVTEYGLPPRYCWSIDNLYFSLILSFAPRLRVFDSFSQSFMVPCVVSTSEEGELEIPCKKGARDNCDGRILWVHHRLEVRYRALWFSL